MPEVEAVAQRREPAQHPAHRAEQRQPQPEADEHRCCGQRQRHPVDELELLVLRRPRLQPHTTVKPDEGRNAQRRAGCARGEPYCPAAMRQLGKDERRRHADGQHPAERRELIKKQRVLPRAVLVQRPLAVARLHKAERTQCRQRVLGAERRQQRKHEVKQPKDRQCPSDAVEQRAYVAAGKELLGQRQVRGQIESQRTAPTVALEGDQKADQQVRVVGRQQPRGAAAVERRRAGQRQRLAPLAGVRPRQKQAERRQHHKQVDPDAARPLPVV